jgi:hypothetical protein
MPKKQPAGVSDAEKKANWNQHDREAYHAKKQQQQVPEVKGQPKSGLSGRGRSERDRRSIKQTTCIQIP